MFPDVTFDEDWRKGVVKVIRAYLLRSRIGGHGGAQGSLSQYRRYHDMAGILVVPT